MPKFEQVEDSNIFAEFIALPVSSVEACAEMCHLSSLCACYSFSDQIGQCFFKEQVLENPELGFQDGNFVDGTEFLEDQRFISGCVDFQDPISGRISGLL